MAARQVGWEHESTTEPDARLSNLSLSTFGLRREPPRAIDDRPPRYLELFDFDTLFYDVFRGADPGEVICLGPPLLNCEKLLSTLTLHLPGQSVPLAWKYLPPRSRFQPSFKLRLTGPQIDGADRLILQMAGHRIEIAIRPNAQSRFAGRRVIMTLSRDNPLPWIRDWALFNARVHGADAVLLYDNGSSGYDMTELGNLFAGISGIEEFLVVPWRFPYGPGVGPRNVQDSFFCQPGTFEHARRRYCSAAKGALNNDIDELTVTGSGESIFDLLERSAKAAIVFPGLWVESRPHRSAGAGTIRHTDCLDSVRWRPLLGGAAPTGWLLRTKWIVQPARCPEDADWGVHDLYPAQQQTPGQEAAWKYRTRRILYRHFRAINTKPARRGRGRYSPITHGCDRPLARAFAVAFPDRPSRERKLRPAGLLARLLARAARWRAHSRWRS
jgi:hypothetical protein